MDTNDVEVYARVADLLVQQTHATNQMSRTAELLNSSVTQLLAVAMRIERRLGEIYPAGGE